jgi:organic radical activating enzyme
MSKKLNEVIWIKDGLGGVKNDTRNIDLMQDLLDSTGKGFCLAKFTQVTMHLGTGLVHSCHHPSAHKIPLEEIAENPGALFNTKHLKKAREEMLCGSRPGECDYCWRIEDSGGTSDRVFKSLEPWALSTHDTVLETGSEPDYYPSYLEVDFSNVCNFACIYCGPEYSSKWTETLKQKGAIRLLDGTGYEQWAQGWQKDLDSLTYKNREFNPYVDAFWKWFPEAYKHLKVYRITGGEPLMSKETFRSMDWLISNPNPELEFNINSNLCVPDKLWDQFIEKAKELISTKSVKKFTVFTSAEAWGKRAEYARVGMDFEMFKRRYEQLLQIGDIRAVIMSTFNILSITSIKEMLEWHLSMKKKYNINNMAAIWEQESGFNFGYPDESYTERKAKTTSHNSIVGLDIPYLRHPTFLDAQLANADLVQRYLIPAINFMADNTTTISTWKTHHGFEEYELEKFKRVCLNVIYNVRNTEVEDKNVPTDTLVNRAKFYDFIIDIDARHNQNFLETFPEMTEYWGLCKDAKNTITKLNSKGL